MRATGRRRTEGGNQRDAQAAAGRDKRPGERKRGDGFMFGIYELQLYARNVYMGCECKCGRLT